MVCRLIWCQTDLGANALNWPKLLLEERRFGGLASEAGNFTADHFDGIMAETLVVAGTPLPPKMQHFQPGTSTMFQLPFLAEEIEGVSMQAGRCSI